MNKQDIIVSLLRDILGLIDEGGAQGEVTKADLKKAILNVTGGNSTTIEEIVLALASLSQKIVTLLGKPEPFDALKLYEEGDVVIVDGIFFTFVTAHLGEFTDEDALPIGPIGGEVGKLIIVLIETLVSVLLTLNPINSFLDISSGLVNEVLNSISNDLGTVKCIIVDSDYKYPINDEKYIYLTEAQSQNLMFESSNQSLAGIYQTKQAYYKAPLIGTWHSVNISEWITLPKIPKISAKVGDIVEIIKHETDNPGDFFESLIDFNSISIEDDAFKLYKNTRGFGNKSDGEFIKYLITNGEIYSIKDIAPGQPDYDNAKKLCPDVNKFVYYTANIIPSYSRLHSGEFYSNDCTNPGIYTFMTSGRPAGSESDEYYILYVDKNGKQSCNSIKHPEKWFSRTTNTSNWLEIKFGGLEFPTKDVSHISSLDNMLESGVYAYEWLSTDEIVADRYDVFVMRSTTADSSGYYAIKQVLSGRNQGKGYMRMCFRKSNPADNPSNNPIVELNKDFITQEQIEEILEAADEAIQSLMENKKVNDAVVSDDTLTIIKSDGSSIEFQGGGNGGVKTINNQAPDANGNINVATMTEEEKQNLAIVLGTVKRGVMSQTQTWASDYSGYTMSNQVWGIIPQANIDLFVSAGAEFNDTDAPITKTAPWGEEVQHLPGYFYLNGLGDISYDEMQAIHRYGNLYLNNLGRQTPITWTTVRTMICGLPLRYTYNAWHDATIGSFQNTFIEVFGIDTYYTIGSNRQLNGPTSLGYTFQNNKYLRVISLNVSKCTTFTQAFTDCMALKICQLKGIKANIDFASSNNLYTASILYMIQNSAAATPITITLHPNAYARAMADDEILAALNDKPLVSLVSA